MAKLPGRRYQTAIPASASIVMWWASLAILAIACVRLVDGSAGIALALGWLAIPLVFFGIQKRRIARYTRALQSVFVSEGDPERAERELVQLETRFRWPATLVRTTGYYRAATVLRQGRLDEAITMLEEIDRRGEIHSIDAMTASTLAFAHALRGDLDTAQAWLAEAAVRRGKEVTPVTLPDLGTEVVIDLRRGRFREVQVRLADQWPEMERVMTGERLRRMRVLRAFAVAQGDVREAGAVGPLLAPLQPGKRDEFAYLATAWPELDRFLRTNLS